MIRIGKLQLNSSVNPKVFLLLSVLSFILLIIFCGCAITNFIKTKDYVKVEATITEIGFHHHYESSSYSDYIKFEYEYNNNSYTNEQRVAFRSSKKVGNIITIYVNPLNPSEVRDNYLTRLCGIASIIVIIFNLFFIKAYKTIKKQLK